jgi:pyruvate formate lyase activating enzyme
MASRLSDTLDRLTIEGTLYEQLPDSAVRCFACAHRCLIRDGKRGVCKVRFNRGGRLYVPHGYVAGLNVDPIEKKPLFHVLPGSGALTFGMVGCNLHCPFCQNWLTSQTLRDAEAGVSPEIVSADQIVAVGERYGAQVLVSSYNEPLITTEWALEIFKKAKALGMRCAYVSNGYITPETLEALRPYLDAYKIDLKTMQDRNYRKLGAVLNNILDGIRRVYAAGVWLEIVTLVVPGFNDSTQELWDMARFIAALSPDIPWHVTAFHRDYKMTSGHNTDARTLIRAAEIGQEAGLRYVYTGNLPGQTRDYESTHCPNCNELLISRLGFHIRTDKLAGAGRCPRCQTAIAGLWD